MGSHPAVFLAHASEDKNTVRVLHQRLSQAGVRPWLDELDLLPGQDWQTEIAKALAACDFVIACISKNSVNKNGFVQKELRTALSLQGTKAPGTIYLIPVILDGSEPPDLRIPELGLHLRNIQWLDLNAKDAFSQLLRSLGCSALSGSGAAPMVEVAPPTSADWPYEKPCPKCGGILALNHEMQEYGCRSCDYWEYSPPPEGWRR